jgi:preprotein translocase subunit SecF
MAWITPGKDIDFMGYRPYFLGLSILLMVASAIAMYTPGPRWGIDFKGGTELEVAFTKPVEAGDLRKTVEDLGFAGPDVVQVADDNNPHRFMIRVREVSSLTEEQRAGIIQALCLVPEGGAKLDSAACPEGIQTEEVKFSPGGDKVSVRYKQSVCGPAQGDVKCPARADIAAQLSGKVAGVDMRAGANNPVVQNVRDHRVEFFLKSKGDQIMDGLKDTLGAEVVPAVPLRVEWIGPKAGRQLRDAAIKSISIAILFIMVYIAFRFDMRFAPGAIAALVHDVFLAMGAMVLAQREVTLSTVAALLTIVGYSINDTVVVYDRIRENLGTYRKMTFPKIINRSVTEMLGRTIRTSGLTAAAVSPFLFWGTGVIKDFAFTLLVGVVVGTYSSIYIAAPLTELIDRRLFKQTVKKKRRVRRRKKGATKNAGAPA